MWFSSYQPYWTQPRSSFNTPLPDTLVSYVSEQSSPSMCISEGPGESVDLLDVLKGSAALVYSWTHPWDVDDMAIFMVSLGHWDLSSGLVPLTSHWWLFSIGPWPHGNALSLYWYGFYILRWWYLHVTTFLDLWVPFSIAFGYYVWKCLGGKDQLDLMSCWSEISLVSCWRTVHLGWMSFWFPPQLFSEHYFSKKLGRVYLWWRFAFFPMILQFYAQCLLSTQILSHFCAVFQTRVP